LPGKERQRLRESGKRQKKLHASPRKKESKTRDD